MESGDTSAKARLLVQLTRKYIEPGYVESGSRYKKSLFFLCVRVVYVSFCKFLFSNAPVRALRE